MATEVTNAVPSVAPALTPPWQAWLGRLGLSGKLLAIGGLVGFIAVFLPLLSVSVQMPSVVGRHTTTTFNIGGIGVSSSVSVIHDWRGQLGLIGYIAALVLAYVLYPVNGLRQRNLNWAGAGVGGFVALLALWLLISAGSGSSSLAGFGLKVSIGFGAILNFLAAGTVAAGGFLKAREEKLF